MNIFKNLLLVCMFCSFALLPATLLGAEEIMKIKVGTSADFPPFESIDEDSGKIIGFDIDLMNAIAKGAGLEVEYTNVDFDKIFGGLVNNEYDAVISGVTITEEREEAFDFSDPYITVIDSGNKEDYGIVVKKGNKELLSLINSGLKELIKRNLILELKTKWGVE
jgi:polar amino acid transport system substrate-binding protein